MSTAARRQYARGIVFGAVLAGILSLLFVDWNPLASARGIGAGTGAAAPMAGSTPSFAIEGNTTEPISPGVGASLDLKLTNPHDASMSVTDVSVAVREVSAPNADDAHPCTLGDFWVKQASRATNVVVPARSMRTLSRLSIPLSTWPQVGMLDRPIDQDGCKGASLTLTYTASGTLGSQ